MSPKNILPLLLCLFLAPTITAQSLVGYFIGSGWVAEARRVAGVVCIWSAATGGALAWCGGCDANFYEDPDPDERTECGTHDLDEAIKLGDRIVLMKDGAIVQVGTAEEILTNPADDYVARFVEDVDMTKVINAESVMKKVEIMAYYKTDGPKAALRKMQKAGITKIFVREGHRVVGLVTADNAVRAAKRGDKTLDGIIDPNIRTVSADTSAIEELRRRVEAFHDKHQRPLNLPDLMFILAVGFGVTGLAHALGDESLARTAEVEALHRRLSELFVEYAANRKALGEPADPCASPASWAARVRAQTWRARSRWRWSGPSPRSICWGRASTSSPRSAWSCWWAW